MSPWSCSESCGFSFLSLCSLQSLKSVCYVGFRPAFISLLLVRAYFSLLPLARNLVWLTAGPFGAPFRRGRSSRFGQIWKRGPGCQGALRWRCQRMMRGSSSPINGENQRFWKHLSKNFFRGETHAVHLARHPSPLHGKNRANWHHLQKIFQHVIHHLMSKIGPFGNLFRKIFSNCFARVSIVIDHPCEFCQHHLLSAGPYCPLSLYVKIEAEWKHFLKIFW